MLQCKDPYIVEISSLNELENPGNFHLQEMARHASVAEILESLGADCLEIRFVQE